MEGPRGRAQMPGFHKAGPHGPRCWRSIPSIPRPFMSRSPRNSSPTPTVNGFGNADPSKTPGRSGQLFKSADEGTTWTPTGRGFPDSASASFVFDPKNAGTIYAPYVQLSWSGGAPPAFGLVKSTDGG